MARSPSAAPAARAAAQSAIPVGAGKGAGWEPARAAGGGSLPGNELYGAFWCAGKAKLPGSPRLLQIKCWPLFPSILFAEVKSIIWTEICFIWKQTCCCWILMFGCAAIAHSNFVTFCVVYSSGCFPVAAVQCVTAGWRRWTVSWGYRMVRVELAAFTALLLWSEFILFSESVP